MSHIDTLVHESRWDALAIQHLQESHHETLKPRTTNAAGWHGAGDIPTLIGLEGRFLWAEDAIDPMQISFKFAPGHLGDQGYYTLGRGGMLSEQGVFYSVPNNPAIGWAAVTLSPQTGGSGPRSFIVSGMMTDNEWRISIMLLNKVGATGPLQPAFPATRIA